MTMNNDLGGRFTFPGTDLEVNRMGYGAMQLAGPGVFGPPKDENAAIAVLREAVEAGVDHIDTSDYYGPHFTNQIIKKALHPYPDNLVIVTKLGARRPDDGSWVPAFSAEELTSGLHDNLRNLGRDSIVYVVDGLLHTLTEIKRLVAVAELPRFVHAGACAARHRGCADRAIIERNVDFNRGIATAIENLPRVNVNYRTHGDHLPFLWRLVRRCSQRLF